MAVSSITTLTYTIAGLSQSFDPNNIPGIIFLYPNSPGISVGAPINLSFTAGTPAIGTTWQVYLASSGSNPFPSGTWFGVPIPNTITNFPSLLFTFMVDGSSNVIMSVEPWNISINNSIDGNAITTGTIPIAKLTGGTLNYILQATGTSWHAVALTGDIVINAGVSSIQSGVIVNSQINASAAIAVTKLAALTASQVVETDGSGFLTTAATLSPLLGGLGADNSASTGFVTFNAGTASVGSAKFSRDLSVSFTPSGVGDYKIMMAGAGTVVKIYAFVDFPIGNAVYNIVPKNNAGTTMGSGTITGLSGDPKGTAYTSTPSTNNTFVDGDILTFSSSGGNGQGVVHLSIIYTKNS